MILFPHLQAPCCCLVHAATHPFCQPSQPLSEHTANYKPTTPKPAHRASVLSSCFSPALSSMLPPPRAPRGVDCGDSTGAGEGPEEPATSTFHLLMQNF